MNQLVQSLNKLFRPGTTRPYTRPVAEEKDTAPLGEAGPAMGEGAVESPAATPPPQLPAAIGGRYRPVRLIAKGGMGAVYEVVHANTGEHLALKLMLARSLLTPQLVERFRREARIHSSVKNEHVVKVIDADVARELDDVPFLVMELLAGRDLERLCLERRPTATEVVDWMRQLAGALDKAHQEGIVHRDLKPENLFLAEREGLPPIVKILDFGVAKIASEADGQATATGQILGTPRYMAPEQAVDAKQISSAADRFALGLITFRLLCGRHYFAGDNWVRLLREVAKGPQERPSAMGSDQGPAFDAWFARACAMEPRNRFATCAEQVAALANALEGGAAPTNRRRVAVRAAGVAVACGIAVAAWGIAHRRPSTAAVTPVAVDSAAKRAAETSTSVAPVPTPASPKPVAPPPEMPANQPAPVAVSKGGPRSGSARQARRHTSAATPPVATANTRSPQPPPASDRIWDER